MSERCRIEEEEIVIPELEAIARDPDHWTAREEKIMRKYYGRVPNGKLAEIIGRSKGAVIAKAYRMQLTRGARRDS